MDIFDGFEVEYRLDSESPGLWEKTFRNIEYRSISYQRTFRRYHVEYQRSKGRCLSDMSIILMSQGRPIGLWPLTIEQSQTPKIESFGLPLLAPCLMESLTTETKKNISKKCAHFVKLLSERLGVEGWVTYTPFNASRDIDTWTELLLDGHVEIEVELQLYVDLTLPIELIRKSYRRSYRSLADSMKTEWRVEVYRKDNITPGNWNEFKELHLHVAGRVTRTDETWEIQRQAILSNEAFLVCLRDETERMIGGGYFMHTPTEGLYAVGAYDRNYFDKPIGHVIQDIAIRELKSIGCSWYQIGAKKASDSMGETLEKERNIWHFKRGFATNVFHSILIKQQ